MRRLGEEWGTLTPRDGVSTTPVSATAYHRRDSVSNGGRIAVFRLRPRVAAVLNQRAGVVFFQSDQVLLHHLHLLGQLEQGLDDLGLCGG